VNELRLILPLSLTSRVNRQTETSEVRDDKLGGDDHLVSAEKYEDRIVNEIGLAEREHCVLVDMSGSA
jgi:hypothetical protein